jgi:hypothetical protein
MIKLAIAALIGTMILGSGSQTSRASSCASVPLFSQACTSQYILVVFL